MSPAVNTPKSTQFAALPWDKMSAVITGFTGITATLGGIALMFSTEGVTPLGIEMGLLEHSPFASFLVPGLLLAIGVGLPNILAGLFALRGHRLASSVGALAGLSLGLWILTEMGMLWSTNIPQVFFLVMAFATLATSGMIGGMRSAREEMAAPS